MKVSAIILTKNEEKNISSCLDSLRPWCQEIIVIDDNSSDDTVKLAKDRGVKVYSRSLNGDFSSQRNFGLDKVRGDWVLFVDADEFVSPSLSQEIVRRVKEKNNTNGFFIPRKEMLLAKPLHCVDKSANNWSFGPIKLLRLARKGAGKWKGKVHETWDVKGETKTLKNPLLHNSFPDISTALKKINLYTSIEAKNRYHNNERVSLLKIIFYPLAKFFKNFFWHRGFLDGTAGVIFCLLMSFHSFLVRGKLWSLQTKEDK